MNVKNLIVALVIAAAAALGVAGAASADYTDPFGNTYTDAQVQQFCAALRPGSAAYARYDCANQ